MISGIVDHLWQSTLFAGVAWMLTLALRKNRAQVRYWVWFAASVKFLAPLALLVAVGELTPRRTEVAPAQREWVVAVEQIGEPLVVLPLVAARAERRSYVAPIAIAVWVCGFFGILMRWGRRWTRMYADMRAAMPMELDLPIPVRSSAALFEPGVFGIFRPVLLLPEGIADRLSREQMSAIVAHELAHVRRRDNLTAAMHMFVQAVFWFHPMVWWIGARLIDERERACDEEVVRLGSAPGVYAEGILNVCRLYVESPVACVAGVTGSDLKKRVETIMRNRNLPRLSLAKKAALAVVGVVAIAVPVVVGVLRAQTQEPTPKWEVVSIREGCPGGGGGGGRGGAKGGGGGGGGGLVESSLGRLNTCNTVESFIQSAYDLFANGQRFGGVVTPNSHTMPIVGGPGWIHSDQYEINAKVEGGGTPSRAMMNGPMLRTILEDRFKLRIHLDTKETPVYALTVAKGGSKLKPTAEGSCLSPEALLANPPARLDLESLGTPGQRPCGGVIIQRGKLNFFGMTVAQFARNLGWNIVDRPVIDQTGLTGTFDFHLEYGIDEVTQSHNPDAPVPVASDPTGPSIFTAVQEQLGLRLESTKGAGQSLIIDSVERPSEN